MIRSRTRRLLTPNLTTVLGWKLPYLSNSGGLPQPRVALSSIGSAELFVGSCSTAHVCKHMPWHPTRKTHLLRQKELQIRSGKKRPYVGACNGMACLSLRSPHICLWCGTLAAMSRGKASRSKSRLAPKVKIQCAWPPYTPINVRSWPFARFERDRGELHHHHRARQTRIL